jgi:hypothetical protein
MKYNTNTLFESIKGALQKEEKKDGGFRDILQLKPGNTYTVRFIPNVKDPAGTFFHHFTHGWTSFLTGSYVSALSPMTFGERDPIAEERYRVNRVGTEAEKEKMKSVRRAEQWLARVYVIDDPTNPENNGKVKKIRYGKQIDKIVKDAIQGEMAEEFGSRIFDLTKAGANFKIKVEKQTDLYPSYTSSRFTTANSDLKLTEAQIEEILTTAHEVPLSETIPLKSYDELKKMLDEHYYCKTETSSDDVDEEIISSINSGNKAKDGGDDVDISDAEVEELLKDL